MYLRINWARQEAYIICYMQNMSDPKKGYKNMSDHGLVEENPDRAEVGREKEIVRERIEKGQRDKKLHGERPLLSS